LYETVILLKKEGYMNIWTYFVYNYIYLYIYIYSYMKNFLPRMSNNINNFIDLIKFKSN